MSNKYMPGVDKKKVRLFGTLYTLVLLGFILAFLYFTNRNAVEPMVKNLLHDYYSVNLTDPLYLLEEQGSASEQAYLQAAGQEYGGRISPALLRRLYETGDLTRNEREALAEQAFYQAGTIRLAESEEGQGIYAYTCQIEVARDDGATESREKTGIIAVVKDESGYQITGLVPTDSPK